MKRFDRMVPHRFIPAAVILLAVLTWPSEGWSKTTRQACDVNALLTHWADMLARSSSSGDAKWVVDTYQKDGSVLLPTCANGPLFGRQQITAYFTEFIKSKPVVEIGNPTIGGDCKFGYASGLYTFKLAGGTGPELRARYTYIFRQGLIAQHHSSLEPEPTASGPPSACPPH